MGVGAGRVALERRLPSCKLSFLREVQSDTKQAAKKKAKEREEETGERRTLKKQKSNHWKNESVLCTIVIEDLQ